MRTFLGEYRPSLDDKGRLILPAKLREGLGHGFYLTKGLDRCLFIFPEGEWSQLEAKLQSLPFTRSDVRAFTRFFFAGASDGEMDKQGRVLIPPTLREYAGLQKETVVIGVGSRVEIWSAEQWEEYNRERSLSFEEMAEKIVEL